MFKARGWMRTIYQLGITLRAGILPFGQGISVKTVPPQSTDPFSSVPSFRDGMAGGARLKRHSYP